MVSVVPPTLWLAIFFLLPGALIGVFSFGESSLFGPSPVDLSTLTLDRYREVLGPTFRIVFANTLELAVVGTILCVALALPAAYLITHRLTGFWRYLVLAAVVVPYWMPFLLRTYAWRLLLGDAGPVASLLNRGGGFGLVDTLAGAQLGVVYNYLPLAVLPIAVSLDRLDPTLRHAGRDLGAPPWRVFWQVTMPAARPGMVGAALLVFIPLMGDYVTPSILGGVKASVAGSLVASSFLESQDWALGAAAAMVLVVLVLAVLAIAWLLLTLAAMLIRRARPLDRLARWRPSVAVTGARDWWTPALRAYGVAFCLFLWVPIVTVLAYSFNRSSTLPVWGGFGSRWYAAVPANPDLVHSVVVSVRVGLLSTAVAVVLGTLAGVALARAGRAVRWSLTALLLVVFVTPEIVSATGLLLLFVAAGQAFEDGTFRLVVAHSVISIAIVTFVVQARLASLDPRLPDAAADLGAPPRRSFRRVVLPLTMPAVLAGTVLALTTSLDDVVSASMLGNVGTTTLPVFIYSSLRNGLKGDAAAASVLVMTGLAMAVLLVLLLMRRRGQGRAFIDGLTGR